MAFVVIFPWCWVFPEIPRCSMGLEHLPTCSIKLCHSCIRKYSSPMDHRVDMANHGWVKERFWTYLDVFQTAETYRMWRVLWPWPTWWFLFESFPVSKKFPTVGPTEETETWPYTWVSNSSIATYWTGSVGKVPFNFFGVPVCCRHPLAMFSRRISEPSEVSLVVVGGL